MSAVRDNKTRTGLVLVFLLGVWLISTVVHAVDLSRQERLDMARFIDQNMDTQMNQPLFANCWRRARGGDEQALASLFVMGRAVEVIEDIDQATGIIFEQAGSGMDIGQALHRFYNSKGVRDRKALIRGYAPALRYCEERMAIDHPDAYVHPDNRDGARQDRTRRYLELMQEGLPGDE